MTRLLALLRRWRCDHVWTMVCDPPACGACGRTMINKGPRASGNWPGAWLTR